jgi:hypothetical protein
VSKQYSEYGVIPPANTLALDEHFRDMERGRLAECPVQRTNTVYAAPWGNDTNGNGSITAPYQHYAKLCSLAAVNTAGDTAYLMRGGQTYREIAFFAPAGPNTTLGSWGGGKATVSFFTLQYPGSGWTAASGNAFSRLETNNPAAVRLGKPFSAYETALALVSSAAACGTTPQSWYYDGSANLYVNLTSTWAVTATVTGSPTGGTWTLSTTFTAYSGPITSTVTLPYNATAAQIQTALQATFNMQRFAAVGLLCSVTGTNPFTILVPAVGGDVISVSASGAGLTGGTSPAATASVTQGTGINPSGVPLEAVPDQSQQGIGINNVDGTRVKGVIFMGLGVSNENHVVGINANLQGPGSGGSVTPLPTSQQLAVFDDIELYYCGYHGMGSTGLGTGATGGAVLIRNCKIGFGRDPDGGGNSPITFYQDSGGNEMMIDRVEIVAGNIPSPPALIGSSTPIIAHTNSGYYALYWEKGVKINPHPQAPRFWNQVTASAPPAGTDPNQIRAFVSGRQIGTDQYPSWVNEGSTACCEPNVWHTGLFFNAHIGAENTSQNLGFASGWVSNATVNLFVEDAGSSVSLWTPSQDSTFWAYGCTFIFNQRGQAVVTRYGSGVSNGSMYDSIVWGTYNGSGGAVFSDVAIQVSCTYYGIYSSLGTITFPTYLDPDGVPITAIGNSLPYGTLPDPARYLPGLAQYLTSVDVAAPYLEYDAKGNDRTLQAARYVGSLVPGRDGQAELQEWNDATEIMDEQGWGLPLSNANLVGNQDFVNNGQQGVGPLVLTITTLSSESSSTPLPNVDVSLNLGITTLNGVTNGSGQVTFNLSTGTWDVVAFLTGYQYPGSTIPVTGNQTATIFLTPTVILPPPPTDNQLTGFLYTEVPGTTIYYAMIIVPPGSGMQLDGATQSHTSDSSGLWVVPLYLGATYTFNCGGGPTNTILIPNSGTTLELQNLLSL